jgi:hypothetical protein
VAPATPYLPGRQVEFTWAGRVQPPGHSDHMVAVVSVSKPGPQEDAAQVDVVGDTAAEAAGILKVRESWLKTRPRHG